MVSVDLKAYKVNKYSQHEHESIEPYLFIRTLALPHRFQLKFKCLQFNRLLILFIYNPNKGHKNR